MLQACNSRQQNQIQTSTLMLKQTSKVREINNIEAITWYNLHTITTLGDREHYWYYYYFPVRSAGFVTFYTWDTLMMIMINLYGTRIQIRGNHASHACFQDNCIIRIVSQERKKSSLLSWSGCLLLQEDLLHSLVFFLQWQANLISSAPTEAFSWNVFSGSLWTSSL